MFLLRSSSRRLCLTLSPNSSSILLRVMQAMGWETRMERILCRPVSTSRCRVSVETRHRTQIGTRTRARAEAQIETQIGTQIELHLPTPPIEQSSKTHPTPSIETQIRTQIEAPKPSSSFRPISRRCSTARKSRGGSSPRSRFRSFSPQNHSFHRADRSAERIELSFSHHCRRLFFARAISSLARRAQRSHHFGSILGKKVSPLVPKWAIPIRRKPPKRIGRGFCAAYRHGERQTHFTPNRSRHETP